MNEPLLEKLQAGTQKLFEIIGNDQVRHEINETIIQFNLEIQLELTFFAQTLNQLKPFTDLFNISLAYNIQNGQGAADLRDIGLIPFEWEQDDSLSPPSLIDTAAIELFSKLTQQLGQRGTGFQSDIFAQNLDQLEQAGADIALSLYISLDKSALVGMLEWPQNVNNLIYISADNFLQQLTNSDFWKLGDLLITGDEDTLIVLLGTALGFATGPNIRIYGLDHWDLSDELSFRTDNADRQKIPAALNFRKEESNWEIETSDLTPYHLYIERQELDQPEILETIAKLRDRLAVAYLADHVKFSNGKLECQFRGYKRVWITFPPLTDDEAADDVADSIFKLFSWGYENSSSDKLGIVKQIISLQLNHDTGDNYAILRERAADILGAAKSNFRIFLQRSVELYFDKRLKVSEFIQKFSTEMGTSVSELTSELISNLYKTVGIILGVVLAALVKPNQTPLVIYLTSLLYLFYIGFILFYLLIATYLRFNNKVQEYRHSITELHDVLSNEEISRLQGNSFSRARWLFLIYFTVTNLLYALLGLVAFLLMRFFQTLL